MASLSVNGDSFHSVNEITKNSDLTSRMNNTSSDIYTWEEMLKGNACSLLDLTNEGDAEAHIVKLMSSTMVLIGMFTVLTIGVSGNITFLLLVVRVKRMRNATNMYLTNLAVVDLAFLCISVITYYFYFTSRVRNHLTTASVVGCIGAFMLPYLTFFVSLTNVTLVTLDKYNAICNPLEYIQRRNGARATKLITGSWIISVLLTAMIMLCYAKLTKYCALWPDKEMYRDLPTVLGYCGPISTAGLVIGHSVEVVVFIVALVGNLFMYARIIKRLGPRMNNKKLRQNKMHIHAVLIRKQVARLLIVIGTVFFLCMLPYQVIFFGLAIGELLGTPRHDIYIRLVLPLTISHLFVFLNSAANPVIYNLTSSHYRQAFKQVLCCIDVRGRKNRSQGNNLNLQGSDNNCLENVKQAEKLGFSATSKV